jgi:hypothetical protein
MVDWWGSTLCTVLGVLGLFSALQYLFSSTHFGLILGSAIVGGNVWIGLALNFLSPFLFAVVVV